MARVPRVRVVVVNYNGGDLTLRCVDRVLATRWPATALEVVVVDNASTDGVVGALRRRYPVVRVVESPVNTGYAGGCNLGMGDVGTVDYVALLNNDVMVEPGWLAPLVEALEHDRGLGAASPKMLLGPRFVDLRISAPTHERGRGDHRELGVRVGGLRVGGAGGEDVWPRALRVEGFWGREPAPEGEPGAVWTAGEALVRVPVPDGGGPTPSICEIRLAAGEPGPVTVTVESGGERVALDVDGVARWFEVPLAGAAVDVVNNAGSVLVADGYGADRGYMEPDTGQYDEPIDVFAWCGGAVLLSSRYLADAGSFDERLFLYYEDVELSWRGATRGWRYRYVPASVVRHLHSVTSVQGSPAFEYYNERNHLLVLTRHASLGRLSRSLGHYSLVTASYVRRDVVSPLLHGERPRGDIASARLRALGGYLRRAPSFVKSRRTSH